MTDLAIRIETEPPSRALDAEIALYFGWKPAASGWWHPPPPGYYQRLPRFTRSLDAAASLMPTGWIVFEIAQEFRGHTFTVKLMHEATSRIVAAVAPTEAQARAAAAVRAMNYPHSGNETPG